MGRVHSVVVILALSVGVVVVRTPAARAQAEAAMEDEDALRAIADAPLVESRPVLRRAARAAPRPTQRAVALQALGLRDPSMATGRICARALRVDPAPLVRRAAAECVGRLTPDLGAPFTPALVAALRDPALDVVAMAGWALANVGDPSSVAPVSDLAWSADARVARIFLGFAERQRTRLGLRYEATPSAEPGIVPTPTDAILSQTGSLQSALASGWLGIYGVMAGWVHGSYLVAAHGGPAAEVAALAGLGAAALGGSLASSYAFLRAPDVIRANTVVQIGVMGTAAGFGLGLLSGLPPTSGIATANLGFLGTVIGTTAGIALVESQPPTPSAQALGLAVGITTALATLPLSMGHRFSGQSAAGAALLVGGASGALATVLFPRSDVGLFPLAGGVAGAATMGLLGAFASQLVEDRQRIGPAPTVGVLSEATGWLGAAGVGAGFAIGAVALGLLPRHLDPLAVTSSGAARASIGAPTVSALASVTEPGRVVPVALWVAPL